jgi:hypothetical protein
MSYNVQVDGRTIWDPALRIGQMYLGLVAGASAAIQTPSGLVPDIDDTCEIDIKIFEVFVERLRDWYFSTHHPVQHQLMRGVLQASLVVLERGGAPAVAKNAVEAAFFEEAAALGMSMVE